MKFEFFEARGFELFLTIYRHLSVPYLNLRQSFFEFLSQLATNNKLVSQAFRWIVNYFLTNHEWERQRVIQNIYMDSYQLQYAILHSQHAFYSTLLNFRLKTTFRVSPPIDRSSLSRNITYWHLLLTCNVIHFK